MIFNTSSIQPLIAIFAFTFLFGKCDGQENAKASVTAPPIVCEMAKSYVSNLEADSRTSDLLEKYYIGGFFSGFTKGKEREVKPYKGEHAAKINALMKGEVAGYQYRKQNPDSIGLMFAGFGYKFVEYRGEWRTAFEASQFRPDSPGFRKSGIWIWPMHASIGKVKWSDTPKPEGWKASKYVDEKRLKKILGRTASVKVCGYISPKGEYGHIGMYEFDLYATSIEPDN